MVLSLGRAGLGWADLDQSFAVFDFGDFLDGIAGATESQGQTIYWKTPDTPP